MTPAASVSPDPPAAVGAWSIRNLWALVLLTLVAVFNMADRAILGVVQEPLKHELRLSDGQLGLLHGLAFALFYAFVALPVARWSETRPRVPMLSLILGIWSAMTAACALMTGFWQLAFGRMLVGAAESGGGPISHSLISDTFPRAKRARAMAIYSAGIPLGLLVGGSLGGWVAHTWGWREAFVAVGLPGVVLAVLVRLTIREPARGTFDGATGGEAAPTLAEAIGGFLRTPSFVQLIFASAASGFAIYGVNAFVTSLLIREHRMDLASVGALVGAAQGISGFVGTLIGGLVTDRFAARDARAYFWVPALGTIGAGLLFAVAFLTRNLTLCAGALVAAYFFSGFKTGPSWAAAQNLASPRSRAIAAAVVTLTITMAGAGLGPTVVGFLSDALAGRAFPAHLGGFDAACPGGKPLAGAAATMGEACRQASASGVRGALLVCVAVYVWAGVHFLLGARTARQDMAGR